MPQMRGRQGNVGEPYLLLLTEAVQVVTLFPKELATSCESPPDFLTVRQHLPQTNKVDEVLSGAFVI